MEILICIDLVFLNFQMMKDKTATFAELETAVNANCNAIKRETEIDLSKNDKSKAIIKKLFYLLPVNVHVR